MKRVEEKRRITLRTGWPALVVILLVVLSLLAALPGAALSATVMLEWDPSTDESLAGYRVYYQAESPAQPFQGTGAVEGGAPIDVSAMTSAAVSGLDPGSSYYFAVTAYNTSGMESVYSNVVEIKESLSPVVTFASPSAGSTVRGAVTVAANATDNKGVTSAEFYVNGNLIATDTSAPYDFDWNTDSLASGSYTVTAKAYDAAGNVGQAETNFVVAGDTTAPVVGLGAPASGATVSGNVTVTVAATDDTGIARIELYVDGSMLFATNQGPATYIWNSLAAGNGSHVLTARAFDAAGNVGAATTTVNVLNDLVAPVAAVTSPAGGTTLGGVAQITASASDDVGVTAVSFYLNGTLLGTDSSAPFAWDWNTAAYANGSYTVSVKAYDQAGRVGESLGTIVSVFNDVTAPAVAITSPGSGSTVDASSTVTVAASDNVAVARIDLHLNGALLSSSNGGALTFNWYTATLPNGTYVLSAKAYDAAGNVGQSQSVSVIVQHPAVDTVAPVVTLKSPGSTVYSSSVKVSATATDNIAVKRMEVYVDGVLKGVSSVNYINVTVKLSTGVHTLTVKAYDAAGNVGTVTRSVTRR